MKRLAILFVLTFITGWSQAQEKAAAYEVDQDYNLWNFQKEDQAYVFADMAYIREYPNLKASVVDSLIHGQYVVIKSEGYNKSKIRGFYAPWHEIVYYKDKQQKRGFIWSGLLALNGSKNTKGEHFIYGFKKGKLSPDGFEEHYEIELKVFDQEAKFITKTAFHVDLSGQTATETKILSGMGLQNVQNIHRLAFLSEACGIPTHYYYVFWNGSKLDYVLDKMLVSDAGVFYHEETILFPAEHKGDSALIFKNSLDAENVNDDVDNPKFKETKSTKTYRWDGKILSEILILK